jgi:cytochrome c553
MNVSIGEPGRLVWTRMAQAAQEMTFAQIVISRAIVVFALISAFVILTAMPAHGAEEAPAWAYPVNPPGLKLPPDDGMPLHVPGSEATFTLTQTRDRFLAPVWHPDDHPTLPAIVANGRKPDVWACGFCHRADGPGGPENANLAGLPASYFIQQMADYKSGMRRTSVPKRNVDNMMSIAKAATDAEIEAAAAYFAALKPKAVIKVVESELAPKTYITSWHLAAVKSGETEALGQRIIEVPEDIDQFARRDARARFIAYVPHGSIQKGRALAAGEGGKTVACASCHGPDLKGLGQVPGIAGRSPSYSFRQLYDFKSGARAGIDSAIMKPTVDKLTVEDMIALAAYVASLAP